MCLFPPTTLLCSGLTPQSHQKGNEAGEGSRKEILGGAAEGTAVA